MKKIDIEQIDMTRPITMGDIARLAGFHHNTAWAWQKSHPHDFPRPCGLRIGANNKLNNVYPMINVIAWLIRHRKIEPIDGINPDENLRDKPAEQTFYNPRFDNVLARRFIAGILQKKQRRQANQGGTTITVHIDSPWAME